MFDKIIVNSHIKRRHLSSFPQIQQTWCCFQPQWPAQANVRDLASIQAIVFFDASSHFSLKKLLSILNYYLLLGISSTYAKYALIFDLESSKNKAKIYKQIVKMKCVVNLCLVSHLQSMLSLVTLIVYSMVLSTWIL